MRRLSATLLVLAAAGCASAPAPAVVEAPRAPPNAPGPPPPTIERTWRLAFMDGAPETLPVAPTLKLAADTVNGLKASGFAGCGEFSAPASLQGISIQFERVAPAPATTDCGAEAKKLETAYVAALASTRRLTIRAGYLVLINESGREHVYFTPG